MKKAVSFILTVCIILSLTVSLGIASGVTVALAATSEAEELWMAEGSPNALLRGERIAIENGSEPYLYAGETTTAYVPVGPVCKYLNASYSISGNTVTLTWGSNTVKLTRDSLKWTVNNNSKTDLLLPTLIDENGTALITLETAKTVAKALNGMTLNFWKNDDSGVIILSTGSITYSDSYASLEAQIKVLHEMLFDEPSGDKIYNDLSANIGEDTHPRILADEEKFDELRAVYGGKSTQKDWISAQIIKANNYIAATFTVDAGGNVSWKGGSAPESMRHPYYLYDENGNRLVGVKSYGGKKVGGSGYGDGYDEGGRLNEAANISTNLLPLAFAYQITGEYKYASAAYTVIKQLGTWEHWGDCHSLNVSDTAVNVAIAVDWIWHAFDTDTAKLDEICEILFDFGLNKGYELIRYKGGDNNSDANGSPVLSHRGSGKCAHYSAARDNNWQTVCGSGMILSALTLMGNAEYNEIAKTVASTYLKNTKSCLIKYAPDGGYVESPAYWSYGTGALFLTLGALTSAAGSDYGYLDAIGLQDSFYFACYINNTNYNAWNFHDGEVSAVRQAGFLYLASALYGDANIAALRDKMINETGAEPSLTDIIFYDEELIEAGGDTLALDFKTKGLETVTMRSSWERGGNFVGLHAGANIVDHGDIDSGNFYLEMGGILWAGDLGSENYNIGRYFNENENRYSYYKKSAEGHNTIAILNSEEVPYGQVFTTDSTDHAQIVSYKSEANGAITIVDMKPSYGSTCTSGRRGLLFTNSRNTVVIQDEITFSSNTDLAWICALTHVQEISADGKTVYAETYNAGKSTRLRATLISDNPDLKFAPSGVTHLLAPTVSTLNAKDKDFVDYPERATAPSNRLVIKASGVKSFKVAVVFELIRDEEEVVGYKWQDMSAWASSGIKSDEWVKDANSWIDYEKNNVPTYKYTVTDLVMAMAKIGGYDVGTPERLQAIQEAFIRTTSIDKTVPAVQAKIAELQPYLLEYAEYVSAINAAIENFLVKYVLPREND